MTKQLTQEELSTLKDLHTEFTRAKLALAEAEMAKHSVMTRIEEIKNSFVANENYLIMKYGENSVINIQTGEVTENKQ
jgi:hypothetical protein